METMTRNATLTDLGAMLQSQHVRKIDVVAPADKIWFEGGRLIIAGVEPLVEEDGVTQVDGVYDPTEIFDEGIATKLNIPLGYLRRLRGERVDLYDMNVNGWLHGDKWSENPGDIPGDERSFFIRMFRGDAEGTGIARAFLSNGYKVVDNLDVLMATIAGIEQAGLAVKVVGCSLTERRMSIRVVCEEVAIAARALLGDYRSPYSGKSADELPLMFAGFEAGNSETGSGAFSITPRAVLQVCDNGMTIKADALREIHLGGKMDDGAIQWSEETQQKAVELVTLKTKDAVSTFLKAEYLQKLVDELSGKAAHPVPVKDTIQVVGKKLAFDEATIDGVLEAFMRSGQPTAGGVMQAITAYAQLEQNPDKATALEAAAIPALEFAATL